MSEPDLAARLDRLRERVATERDWYAEHGGSLEGYIAQYGDPGLATCAGDGGTAIHRADLAALNEVEGRLAALEDQAWLVDPHHPY